MSERSQEAFDEFVKKFKDRLESVIPDAAIAEDCSKCFEKLKIYKDFTDGLIKNGANYLNIIEHITEELAKTNDTDVNSIASSSTFHEEELVEDLDLLRGWLSKRVGMEMQAIRSLNDLEAFVDGLIENKHNLENENRNLKDQLKDCEESTLVPIDQTITSNVIATLRHENDDLKQIIIRNKHTLNRIQNKTSDSSTDSDDHGNDCEEQLDALKRKLAEKDRTIEALLAKVKKLMKSKSSDSSETDSESDKANKSDSSSSASNESHDLTDSENKEQDKLRKLKEGYKELALLLKEKYDKLRKQRDKIKELMKQLEECAAREEESIELKDLIAQLRRKNEDLTKELDEIKANMDPLDDIKRQFEICNNELERFKQREGVLARKLALQEEHVQTFLEERENMVNMKNDMLNSILICKTELAKYNVE